MEQEFEKEWGEEAAAKPFIEYSNMPYPCEYPTHHLAKYITAADKTEFANNKRCYGSKPQYCQLGKSPIVEIQDQSLQSQLRISASWKPLFSQNGRATTKAVNGCMQNMGKGDGGEVLTLDIEWRYKGPPHLCPPHLWGTNIDHGEKEIWRRQKATSPQVQICMSN